MICVYKHFDADGKLLYVGCTADFFQRCTHHKKSHWIQHVRRVDIEPFEDFFQAQLRERELITSLNPLFNYYVKQKPKKTRWDVKDDGELISAVRAYVKSSSTEQVIRFAATAKMPADSLLGLIEMKYSFSGPAIQRMVDAIEYLGIDEVKS